MKDKVLLRKENQICFWKTSAGHSILGLVRFVYNCFAFTRKIHKVRSAI